MAGEPKRHRIRLACPECGHRQMEPALVVSTQCRACRAHYQVRNGVGVPRLRLAARVATAPATAGDATPRGTPSPRNADAARKRFFLWRLLFPSRSPREVQCFACPRVFSAVADAQSSQCPKCGSYVSLRDYDISESWNRGIETRGNIVVRKGGSLGKVGIRCHDLAVQGRIAADLDCSGAIAVRADAKFTGTIRCRQLRVEKGTRVEFLQPVHADHVVIEGDVLGQIFCTGPVVLEKRASLKGPVRATSLVLRKGARHDGCVEPSPRPEKRVRL